MYGTVAKLRVKSGCTEQLLQTDMDVDAPGFIASYVFQSDEDPDKFWLVALFESKESYVANAESPEQHERYMHLRQNLASDPVWHDGEVVKSQT
jgi:heme-degrading monooxygenase HmoA